MALSFACANRGLGVTTSALKYMSFHKKPIQVDLQITRCFLIDYFTFHSLQIKGISAGLEEGQFYVALPYLGEECTAFFLSPSPFSIK